MGYIVKEEDLLTGEVRRRGPFVSEQEARMVLANAVEGAYDSNPQLARADVRLEVDDERFLDDGQVDFGDEQLKFQMMEMQSGRFLGCAANE